MLDFLELEETVGRAWHRLVGDAASYPRYPEHGVTLEEMRGALGVFFRGMGGEAGVQLAASAGRSFRHRLNLRQRIGMTEERLEQPRRDPRSLFLPTRIDLFPSRRLNRMLYFWLGAYSVDVPLTPVEETDPLFRDLAALLKARETTTRVLAAHPGLGSGYRELASALLAARPARKLPATEQGIERIVAALLGGLEAGELDEMVDAMHLGRLAAPFGYQPFLPVPLWVDAAHRRPVAPCSEDEPTRAGPSAPVIDLRKRLAHRREADQPRRRDPFVLNRFEKMLTLAEMVNVNRPSDDDEDDEAQKAADDIEDLTVSRRQPGRPAARLKFDLDLPPEAVDTARLTGLLTYPEWDYTRRAYLPDHCRVLTATAREHGETWSPDPAALRRIRRVRRQFEVLRPRHQILRAQTDGEEIDMDALVRSMSEIRAGGAGSDRVYHASRPLRHDLAVALLVDVSLSTDAWVDGHRVLDVEKEALLTLAHGLAACGDHSAILTFTSRRRSWVRVETVKDFDEPMGTTVERRIAALKPGYYTRIGAALRHAAAQLAGQPNRKRLLIVLTDGKPNDVDHYEGRFGIEDTRRAVSEARRLGIGVFGVTVDCEAQSYFPALFGRGGFAIVGRIGRLPSALPAIYRQLAR
ncbi:VWA domain-containing protein [Chelativorans sp. AA-79]|uniref:nitric oxide reductase activation protein NorD n=1 Tax=Chelativorans sp. AA-79 TaxID=3028735 RepID=UPI0023F8A4C2|nr:VWA domain-containing protein [Chelativorans sp. AA-79]WEX08567.1 VWA domain-containing protein [Chelativorans sp. AA-79]